MSLNRILIVEDDAALRTALFRILEKNGWNVLTSSRLKEAELLSQGERPIDVALIDLFLPDGSAIDLMHILKKKYKHIKFIILSENHYAEKAAEILQQGASRFLIKPFNLNSLSEMIKQVLNPQIENKGSLPTTSCFNKRYHFENIIGQSELHQQVLHLVEKVSDVDSTVLITGESGTGKELVAKAIHYNSNRAQGPFIPINCGAIPNDLLESELFGHVKGAFTGAISNRMGRFEMAHGGSLFLDEVGDMNPSIQVKLLRVLQEKKFEPVGSGKTIHTEVRIIAATNVDLEQAVAEGKFREDLYYRLNVIPIHIPSLRERKADIPLLLHHFITLFNRLRNRSISGVTPEAMDLLHHYNWPGNIRELENLIERMAILKGNGLIDIKDLPERYLKTSPTTTGVPQTTTLEPGMDFNTAVDAYENALIIQALEKTGWNRNQAALLLRLNRTTLVEKIKKKGLRPPEVDA
ncbi:MAG: sigma-54 dependent transcriptional regulator [Bdellovibrionales bacterium]|nr:sigma-54 dependent transcriptional regulator [Bdellovibrionales bacterium]